MFISKTTVTHRIVHCAYKECVCSCIIHPIITVESMGPCGMCYRDPCSLLYIVVLHVVTLCQCADHREVGLLPTVNSPVNAPDKRIKERKMEVFHALL